MTAWLYRHWAAAALCMGLFLLLLLPALALSWQLPILLIYLQIPVYMLHQVEEHTNDRFRQFVNQRVFGGVEALTPEAVLVINIPGVWGVTLLSLYAALLFGTGWGLTGIYLVLVNGLIHVIGAVAKRAYNPGLWTALALFLPFGGRRALGGFLRAWCYGHAARGRPRHRHRDSCGDRHPHWYAREKQAARI